MSFTPGAGTSYLLSSTAPVPSGTANGVLYLNGSKVVTSGSGLTFDGTDMGVGGAVESGIKLKVFGAVKVQSAQPIYYMNSDNTNNVQIVNAGATGASNGQLAFTLGGVGEQMRLTSTGLGIGTSSPLGKLDVREANRANSTNITNIGVYTTTAQAADVGGTIGLGGIFDGASGYAPFGSIRGGKENSTVNNYAGYLAFQTIPNGGVLSERMRLDSSGNLGLGVTPSAWGSNYRAFELAGASAGVVSAYVNNLNFGTNIRNDNTNWIYTFTGQNATRYEMSASGAHTWFTAPSGTAGNAISFTQAMTLDANRNLALNTTSVGTSAVGALSIGSGTEPSSGPADTVQLYSVDRSAGNTIPAFYCEGTGVTNAGITNTTVTHKIAMKINGTVYYLLATTNAT